MPPMTNSKTRGFNCGARWEMFAQYVKAYLKGNKNDDGEGLAVFEFSSLGETGTVAALLGKHDAVIRR